MELALWEKILIGAVGVLVLFMFTPGLKGAMEKSRNAQEKHWGTLAIIAAILVLFVFMLISMV